MLLTGHVKGRTASYKLQLQTTKKCKSYGFKFINLSFPGFHSYVLRFCRLWKVDDVIICSKISYLTRKSRIWRCCLGKSPVRVGVSQSVYKTRYMDVYTK